MTPRALDADIVHARLRLMRDLLDDLESVRGLGVGQLERDRMTRHAVERILTQLVDLAVSVNSHVAVAILGRGPADYRESFMLAARAGALPDDLAAELAPSVGLRKLLVHEYATIDLRQVVAAVPLAADGYRRYVAEIARFLIS